MMETGKINRAAIIAISLLLAGNTQAKPKSKPNILLIDIDDLGRDCEAFR